MPKPAQWHLGSDQGEALDLHAPRVMLFITVCAANRPVLLRAVYSLCCVCHVCIRRLESVNGAV